MILAASGALAAPSAPAVAQTCTPQQTVAVLDQYCDSLPTSGGALQPLAPGGIPGAKPLRATLPKPTVVRLRNAGPAAAALLRLTSPTSVPQGPAVAARRRRTARVARKRAGSGQLANPERNVVSLATGLATAGGDVVGGTFRWGLVICTVGLAGLTWIRFRARLRI